MEVLRKLARIALFGPLLAFLGSKPALAGDIIVSNFSGGLDTLDNPSAIQSNFSQDTLNVNIQPGGSAIFKRDGYGLFQTLNSTYTSEGIHGGYHFQQLGGSDVQIWASSNTLYGSVSDASFVALATGTYEATWQCTDSQGYAYCFSSAGDTPIQTDGTKANTVYFSSAPSGTMGAFTPLQLVVAGVSGNANTIYVSAQLAFNQFTPGILPSSPFTEPIASPGSRITHLAYYFGRLFWWKDQSFGYATFTGQNDWQLTIISNQIGTLDNSDAFWNSSGFDSGTMFSGTAQANANASPGGIFFRGQDNHIYVYDGYYLTRLSRPITPTVTAASRKKANSWTQQFSTDWVAGSFNPSLSLSTSVAPPTLTLSSATVSYSTNVPDNSFEGTINTTWTYTTYWSQSSSTAGVHCTITPEDGSYFAMENEICGPGWYGPSVLIYSPTASGCTLTGAFVQGVSASQCSWTLNTVTLPAACVNVPVYIIFYDHYYGEIGNQYQFQLASTSTFISSNTFTFYANMDTYSTGGGGCPTGVHYGIDNIQGGVTASSPIYNTGSFYSQVNNAPNLTSWSNFSVLDNDPDISSITYYVRVGTNSFAVNSATPTWKLQPKNSALVVSTGTYMQARADFSRSTATFAAPSLNNFVFNWYEGSASDKSYMTYFNDAIWFSVSSSSTTSLNNRIFYWDLLNGAWVIYDIPSNGFLIENNALYFGSPSGPYVYKYGGVTTDNGNPIKSYWRSPDFLFNAAEQSGDGQTISFPATNDLFVQKEFTQADFVLGESSTTLSYTYTLDSKNSTVFTMTAYDPAASLIQRNFLLPVGKIGKYYDFTIGDNSSNAKWTLMAHRVHYEPLSWKPVLQ